MKNLVAMLKMIASLTWCERYELALVLASPAFWRKMERDSWMPKE